MDRKYPMIAVTLRLRFAARAHNCRKKGQEILTAIGNFLGQSMANSIVLAKLHDYVHVATHSSNLEVHKTSAINYNANRVINNHETVPCYTNLVFAIMAMY